MKIFKRVALAFAVVALVILLVAEGPRWMDHLFAAARESDFIDPARLPPAVAKLPVILELPAGKPSSLVLIVSGDGGWSAINRSIARAFAEAGYVVAGLDSPAYFDHRRTPERLAADADRLITALEARYGTRGVVLIGYSFGADVLPFLRNGLPAAQQAKIRATVLLSPSRTADFWLGFGLLATWTGLAEAPTLPAVRAMAPAVLLCLYGQEVADASLCPQISQPGATIIGLEGGHHFDGHFAALGRRIESIIATRPLQP